MNLPTLIIAFLALSLFIAFVYFHLFTKGSQNLFMRFWGMCWVLYSFSLLFLILNLNNPNSIYVAARKICDMQNILLLLFGSYSFMRLRIPSFWNRFSLYMVIWVAIGTYYNFDLLSIYLPLIMYQVITSAVLSNVIIRHWDVPFFERTLSLCVFLLWGVGKSALTLLEISHFESTVFYLVELFFSNILNFSFVVIYLQRAQSQLAMADRLYRIIAENASDVIFYYTLNHRQAFAYITPSVEQMTGYTPKDFYNDPEFYLQIVPSSQFNEISEVFHPTQKVTEPYTKSFQILHKNGSTIWAEFNVSVLYEERQPAAVEGFIRDVTRMKETENELLASKMSRQLLLSYISHELKTPVTSILGYVNAIKDGTINNTEDVDNAIDIIFSKSQTLERLINDLFQLSKLETGQFSFHFMRMDALELSKNLLHTHVHEIKAAGMEADYKINTKSLKGVYLIVDPERIDQVLSNIITNAIKYAGSPGKISIRCDIDSKANEYYVSVTDIGPGIDEEDLPHIFERFYKGTLKKRRTQITSTGLGLTISKEIINAHQGSISVKSAPSRGSTFKFTIPFYRE